ncbi:MAG: hypothetical protein COY58_06335 [Gammaproteobacteria bacterium CG_4_10_14_0_8_um_filter_38_16]|nr:MAG: hypothetical protein COY58_06335 [Gammaproteobacteria bacterium CG_4_10_14_0_8_um_filter_38_16]PJA02607.1 MAG: hypothetical protein COX72_09175 [Gammaproteobacteria bacterium CG_4_10_14_0_2_um_filter_38_22]PJB10564.1 MAG: hypothetical protein CO120_04230 [Gammaproteobacteria bacterium CG_4_9_14_3_um_filter_38_9]
MKFRSLLITTLAVVNFFGSAYAATTVCPNASLLQTGTYAASITNIPGLLVSAFFYQIPQHPHQMAVVVYPYDKNPYPTRADARAYLNTATAPWTSNAAGQFCYYQPGTSSAMNHIHSKGIIIWAKVNNGSGALTSSVLANMIGKTR